MNTTYSSLGVQILAAEEKGDAWTDDKSQAEKLSLQDEMVTVNPFSAGPTESKSFFRIQVSPAEVENTAEISAQAYH